MKERGMLFSRPMVLALLDGSKTQTRRICKPQPVLNGHFWELYGAGWSENIRRVPAVPGHSLATRNPYGQPGDRLWVRETFAEVGNVDPGYLIYRANDYMEQVRKHRFDTYLPESKVRWTPSIHMPRRASRIDLEITSVRVERLNDCSEADAKAEGVTDFGNITDIATGEIDRDAVEAYEALWETINGAGSWDANPWVWVIEFRRVKP